MKFSEFLKENGGATFAGDVGGTRGSLFSGTISRTKFPKTPVTVIKYKKLANWNGMKKIHESSGSGAFSSIDVISKLNAAQKHNDMQKDAVVYGIEGGHGEVTKVYIARDQDEEFKHALDDCLKDADDKKDVAEILFNLRNTFNILHVEWPPMPEDEEVNTKLDSKDGEEANIEGELPPGADEAEGELPPAEEAPTSNAGDEQSILFKVIDMLKADAEAKQAEANARAKEAEAKEAGFAAKIANKKVQSEEEMANADNYFKQQKESKKAAEQLSRLAKYRQEVSRNNDSKPGVYTHDS